MKRNSKTVNSKNKEQGRKESFEILLEQRPNEILDRQRM